MVWCGVLCCAVLCCAVLCCSELFANGGRAVIDDVSVGSTWQNLQRARVGGVRLFLNASASASSVEASAAAWHMECGDMKRC